MFNQKTKESLTVLSHGHYIIQKVNLNEVWPQIVFLFCCVYLQTQCKVKQGDTLYWNEANTEVYWFFIYISSKFNQE